MSMPLKAELREVAPRVEGRQAVGRVPPHSIEAEQSVLGAVMLDNEALNAILEVLLADDFYHAGHRVLFESMMELNERLEPIDAVTLSEVLRRTNRLDAVGGLEYISRLVDIVPTSANTHYYARIIKEMSLRRRVIHATSEIAEEAMEQRGEIDAFLDSVEQRIFKVSESRVNPSFVKLGDIVRDSIKQVE
ncbi:MAG: hypothetical protein KDD44_06885, partial [Bdellovibrionales bacterium]|nr:hypothetical protein [Bdellovibrionales bacterium]